MIYSLSIQWRENIKELALITNKQIKQSNEQNIPKE